MGNSILFNTAASIALAINYTIQGPYTDKFITRLSNAVARINAEFFVRVGDAIICGNDNVDVDASDLDAGSAFVASTTYYIYACHPVSGDVPAFVVSANTTYPVGWNADTSRKIGGFTTDGSGHIIDASLWDLRTNDITVSTYTDADARGAVNDVLDAIGRLAKDLNANGNDITNVGAVTAASLNNVLDATGRLTKDLDANGNDIVNVGSVSAGAMAVDGEDTDERYAPQVNQLTNSQFSVNSQSADADYSDANTGFTNDAPTNCCTDPDNDQDNTTGWSAGASATLSSEAGGATGNCLKVKEGGASNPYAFKSVSVSGGEFRQFKGKVKADGSEATYAARVWDVTNSGWLYLIDELEETNNDWTTTWDSGLIEIPSNCTQVQLYLYSRAAGGSGLHTLFDDVVFTEVCPSYTAADSKAPDGWSKDPTLNLYVQKDTVPNGSQVALKWVPGAASDYMIWNLATSNRDHFISRYAGKVITAGIYAKTSIASHLRIMHYDSVGGYTYSDYHTGGGDWEWLTVTSTVAAGATGLYGLMIRTSQASGVCYLAQGMLVFGSHCQQYVPRPAEIINVDKTITLTDYIASDDVTADSVINLREQSHGKIPADIAAVHGWVEGQNSAPDKYLEILSDGSGVRAARLTSQVANVEVATNFRAVPDIYGNIYVDVEDANWDDVTIEISAVELR